MQGFPIDGDIDIKLAKGGVDIPISLKMPGSFGGITGAATLHADTHTGLDLRSLEFSVGDLNLAALELKNLDVSYTEQGDVWKGSGRLLVPAGGAALDATISVEFDKGDFTKGSLEVVPGGYPGIPLDDDDPPPMLYFSHAGLSLSLSPLTLTGDAGIGVLPLKPPGDGSSTDYAIRLEAQLSAASARRSPSPPVRRDSCTSLSSRRRSSSTPSPTRCRSAPARASISGSWPSKASSRR